MNDPRYDNDPAYRQDVFNKLERSNIMVLMTQRPTVPLQPQPGGSGGQFSLDTSGLETKLSEINSQLRILAATDVESFESIISDLQAQVVSLTTQLNSSNTSRQNLRALLLQIDDLIDEDNI